MSYATKHLMPGEEVVKTTQLQWIVYIPAVILLVLAILLCVVVYREGDGSRREYIVPLVFAACSAIAALAAFVKRKASEFAVTNKRVLVKTGLLRRHSMEILLRQVEGITVDQTLLGRMFDFGTIVVEGTGSDRTPYKGIAGPLAFRLAVQEQIERCMAYPTAPQQQPAKDDRYTALLRLNELKEKGILTDQEFSSEKARILASS
jgi:membrane protein YdbS with pleckstrin-like domain